MKTLLVATDFSKAANNAVDYAVQMAKACKAKLILFHAYSVPVIVSEVPVAVPSLDEVEKDSIKRLKRNITKLRGKYGSRINVEYACKCGFAVDEINLFVKENNVDLIIMGMQGTGYLAEKLAGSITTALIGKAACPVLSIDSKIKYSKIKKIVLAVDLAEQENKTNLNFLKHFITLFNSKLLVLNVFRKNETTPTISQAVEGIKIEHLLQGVNHTFHYVENSDVVEGINGFVTEFKADMVAMIPRKHSAIRNLFIEPQTKRMAFHSQVALLTIHN